MESKILPRCSPEKKRSRKRERSETEPLGLVRCSTEEEKSRKKMETTEPESCGLVRSSTIDEKDEKNSKFSCKPLVTTVTKTTTTTSSITIITPPEDPNDHINLYLCIKSSAYAFSWFKIDPTNNNQKDKKKKKRILLSPISHMPPTTPRGFRVIPQYSSKLVYAFGGNDNDVVKGTKGFSSKAFVSDFGINNDNPVWEELPPMPSPLKISMGIASPNNGNVYAFGVMYRQHLSDPFTHMGLVFDLSSRSWNPCPYPTHIQGYCSVKDYAVVRTENNPTGQLVVFTHAEGDTFNLATSKWEHNFSAPLPVTSPLDDCQLTSTSVGVGHLIYKFQNRKLYVLDSSSPEPSFQLVHGLDNKLPTYWETYGKAHIIYLGKGKLCIVWGHSPSPAEKTPTPTQSITCLKFWVGMCNRRNRLRAVIDQCERFVAPGTQLYDVIAF